MPTSVGGGDAAKTIVSEWATSGFGADSKNMFEERLKHGGTAAAGALGHYLEGGGNTP